MTSLTWADMKDRPRKERAFWRAGHDFLRGHEWAYVMNDSPDHKAWMKYLETKDWEPFGEGFGILVVPTKKLADFDPEYVNGLRLANEKFEKERNEWLSGTRQFSA